MKSILVVACLFLTFSVLGQSSYNVIKETKKWQKEMNKEFKDSSESPLTEEDITTFESLEFFPIDTNFSVIAKLEKVKDSKPFKMKTTTNRLPIYSLYGIAHFKLNGKSFKLNIYQNESLLTTKDYKDYLFLPYTDSTNGDTTYGGGRYLDLSIPKGDTIILNFNMSYNPYCAYNPEYSCPIPPKENRLNIPIVAGVKDYKKH